VPVVHFLPGLILGVTVLLQASFELVLLAGDHNLLVLRETNRGHSRAFAKVRRSRKAKSPFGTISESWCSSSTSTPHPPNHAGLAPTTALAEDRQSSGPHENATSAIGRIPGRDSHQGLSRDQCPARRSRASDTAGTLFWNLPHQARLTGNVHKDEETMDGIIYLVGLIVIIMAILSFFGLH
jgi:hypothetical protein